ncbi:MAG: bifunctional (p)ppGpp synthetase/guanosine-3',5'-bis(diphosphate) 3'-pyrophosphohydrolase [Candidatus Pacebacteria bacterium]|nr:bifunctional (p)ppGpp synthetase/guanosine-3',5'-bis(diphosphate) 3'-pyrophosphohydrolase [Candidatus Paceibacterota bacterium]
MTLVEKATCIAVVAHKDQVRKSDGSPYVVHPIMCAMMLAKYDFPEEVVAAALTHDVLEDTAMTDDELRVTLGDTVVDIVRTVSEDHTVDWRTIENGWVKRKQVYIDAVRNGSEGAKAVSIADKIHNAQSLLDAHAEQGPAIWNKFNKGRETKLWFEESLLTMFRETWDHPLIEEYAVLVEKMRALS